MKKLDVEYLTKRFNTLRMSNLDREYSSSQMIHVMQVNGFNKILYYCMVKENFFIKIKKGTSVFYKFTNTPIYLAQVARALKMYRTKINKPERKNNQELQAIKLLKSRGYTISKISTFDVERLKKERPEIYSQFVEVEYF